MSANFKDFNLKEDILEAIEKLRFIEVVPNGDSDYPLFEDATKRRESGEEFYSLEDILNCFIKGIG